MEGGKKNLNSNLFMENSTGSNKDTVANKYKTVTTAIILTTGCAINSNLRIKNSWTLIKNLNL